MSNYTIGLIAMTVGIILPMIGAATDSKALMILGSVVFVSSIVFILYEMLNGGNDRDADQARFAIGGFAFFALIILLAVLIELI